MYRVIVLVLLVAGLMLVVGDIYAQRPQARDTGIPIYLGDPDDVDCSRPRDRRDVKISSTFGRCDFGIGFALFEVRVWFGGRQGKDWKGGRFNEVTSVKGLMGERVGFAR